MKKVAVLMGSDSDWPVVRSACAQLEKDLGQVPHSSLGEAAHYYRYTIFRNMERLRAAADALESITGADYWPYPSYSDILYSVR